VRSLKTALVLILISLGFLVGYFAGWRVHGDNVVRLTPDELDVTMDYESLAKARSMLGSAGIIVIGYLFNWLT